MNRVYKVVSRNHYNKRIHKKTIYVNEDKFLKYSADLILRWEKFWDVEIYVQKDDKWELFQVFPYDESQDKIGE